ncbi:hypothetical protein JCM8097_009357 [Rhodosporidiobolus ruineniae]
MSSPPPGDAAVVAGSSHFTTTSSPTLGTPPADQDDAQPASEDEQAPADGATEADKPKKKRKKRKTAAQKTEAKRRAQAAEEQSKITTTTTEEPYRGVWAWLARNKHLKYISLFNGPWLSLSQRDLATYQLVNSNERSRAALRGLLDDPLTARLATLGLDTPPSSLSSLSPPSSSPSSPLALTHPRSKDPPFRFPQEYLDALASGDAIPPPLDPAAFINATEVRKLVDEATDLALRASSGLSAAELEAVNRNPYASGGYDGLGGGMGLGGGANGGMGGQGGRNGLGGGGGRPPPPMSALRQHRFRALAVSKLAAAYRIDEVATAVVVMQAGENLEELAEKVLKQDNENVDAQYARYFSEKIPSRANSPPETDANLDALNAADPSCLAYHRSKGVHLSVFQQDYPAAIKAFSAGLAQAKSAREAAATRLFDSKPSRKKGGKRGTDSTSSPSSFSTSSSRPSSPARTASDDPPPPQLGRTAGDDLERQLVFLRGMAHFHHARQLIEDAVLTFEGVALPPNRRNDEGGAWTLRNLGLSLSNPGRGIYGSHDAATQERFRTALSEPAFLERVHASLNKAIRDLDRFLAHFPTYEAPAGSPLEQVSKMVDEHPPRPSSLEEPLTFLGRRLVHHRALASRTFTRDPRRTSPSSSSSDPSSPSSSSSSDSRHAPRALLTAFHPLLLEAHSTRLLALVLLGSFTAAAQAHTTLVRLSEHLEGYPLFSSPRVGTQAEYAELVERVWETWGSERKVMDVFRTMEEPKRRPSRRRGGPDEADDDPSSSESDGEDEPVQPSAQARYDGASAVPEDEAHLAAAGPANGALCSLAALSDLFSPSFRSAYIARAEAWWTRVGRAEEEARLKAEEEGRRRKQARAEASGGRRAIAPSEGEGAEVRLGSWLEEREKAEDKMRKIDPSYAPLTTAHTELVLAYLHAAVLPPLETAEGDELYEARLRAEKEREKGKGKGRANGKGREDDGEENGWGGEGVGGAGGSGSGSSRPFNPFGTSAFSSSSGGAGGSGSRSSSSSSSAALGDENGDVGRSSSGGSGSGGKGKGKGKGRA